MRHPFLSYSSPSQIVISTALLPSQFSVNSPSHGLDLIADIGFIGWAAIDSSHSSGKAQALQLSGGITAPAERAVEAAHSEDIFKEAKEKRLEEVCREEEQR